MARKTLTQEEKVAKKLIDTVNDLSLDLEEVGVAIARNSRRVSINRLVLITDIAQDEQKEILR